MQFAATLLECLIPSNALFIRILLGTLLHNWMCSIDIYIFFSRNKERQLKIIYNSTWHILELLDFLLITEFHPCTRMPYKKSPLTIWNAHLFY